MFPRLLRKASIGLLLLLVGCNAKNPALNNDAAKAESAKVSLPVIRVERSNLPIVVSVQGTAIAQPDQSAKISPAVAGKLSQIKVVPGQFVERGQVIAQIDNRQALDQFNQASAAVQAATAGVEQAQVNLRLAQTTLEHQRMLHQAGLSNRQGNDNINQVPIELRPAVAAVAQAQANLRLAQDTLQRQSILYNEKIAAKKDLIAAQNQVETAKAQLEAAKAQVAGIVPEKDLIAAEGQVQTNLAQLNAAQSQVAQSRASRSQSLTQLQVTELRSPISGVVARRFLNVGDSADPATPVIEVVNLATVIINGNLPADKHSNIRVGMHADIRTAAQQSTPIDGTVTAVSPIVDPQSNTVDIRISCANSGNQLKENQTVTVSIATEVHQNTLTVPETALVPNPDDPGGRMVYIVKEDKIERVKVTTGIQLPNQVEITSGLQGNETIVAKGAYGLPDGTAIEAVTK